MTDRSHQAILPRLLILLSLLAVPLLSCSKSESEKTPSGTFTMLDPRPADTTIPPWLEPSRQWPDTLRWSLDSTSEITVDGLSFRMRMSARKVFLGGPDADEHPLWCLVETTIRPVPRWEHVRGMKMDSVVFHDPVRSTWIPSLRMLSHRRTHLEGTLRTSFANDAAIRYTLDLNEGQPLEPTVYFTWDDRTIIVTAPAIPVEFLTERESPKTPPYPEWPEF